MKTLYIGIISLLCSGLLAQNPIPNPGFESWTSGSPTGWSTANVLTITPVTQSSDAHAGSSAAKLQVIDLLGSPYPPSLNCNTVAVTQNYGGLSFYYKCNLSGTDEFLAAVIMSSSGTANGGGSATLTNTNNTNVYTLSTFSITYTSGIANSGYIAFGISSGSSSSLTVGSWVLIDDLSFGSGTPTGIIQSEKANASVAGQLMPNPANGICFVPFHLASQSEVLIEVVDLEGRKVQEVLQRSLGEGSYKAEIRADELTNGFYFCRIDLNGSAEYRKFVVSH